MLYVVIVQVERTLVQDVIDIFTFHVDILMVKRDMELCVVSSMQNKIEKQRMR